MNVPDSTLDEAFAVYEEFGPNRLIERKERLQSEFPQLAPAEVEFVLEQMKSVSNTIWDLAERGGETVIGRDTIERALEARHPFLRARGLEHAVSLVNYFAWHDGYDTNPKL